MPGWFGKPLEDPSPASRDPSFVLTTSPLSPTTSSGGTMLLSISMTAPCEAWCLLGRAGLPLGRFRTYSYNDAYSTFPLHIVSQILSLGLQHPKSVRHRHAHLALNEPLKVHPAHS